MSTDGGDISAAELAEYCRTQAAILTGHTEQLGAEVSSLLDELEADTADTREALDRSTGGDAEEPTIDMADIERKQERVRAKQERMTEYQALTEEYTELAEQFRNGNGDLETLLRFEIDNDAPSYFDSNTTILGAVTDDEDSLDDL